VTEYQDPIVHGEDLREEHVQRSIPQFLPRSL
jgi:hypothetical protein